MADKEKKVLDERASKKKENDRLHKICAEVEKAYMESAERMRVSCEETQETLIKKIQKMQASTKAFLDQATQRSVGGAQGDGGGPSKQEAAEGGPDETTEEKEAEINKLRATINEQQVRISELEDLVKTTAEQESRIRELEDLVKALRISAEAAQAQESGAGA